MHRFLNIALLVTGIAAAATLATPIVLILTITLIGIPLAFIMMAAPTLFLATLLTKLFYAPFKRSIAAAIIAPILAVSVLAMIPLKFNAALERQATALIANDHNDLTKPFAPKTLAVQRPQWALRTAEDCDGFCKRALLNGLFDRVLIQTIDPMHPDADAATAYRLERRPSCQAIDLQPGDDIQIETDRNTYAQVNVNELLQLRIANGECLVREPASLATADAIITVANIHRGLNAYSAGLDAAADTVNADRITVREKTESGFRETYRWTGVVVYKLGQLYAPTTVFGYQFENHPGLWRDYEFKNIPGRFYERPDFGAFVTKTLGLNLALNRTGFDAQARDKIAAILDRAGPIGDADQKLIAAFFDQMQRSRAVDPANYPLILRIVDDRRVDLPSSTYVAIKSASNPPAGYLDHMSETAFQRLHETDPANLKRNAGVFEMMVAVPHDILLKHRPDLEWLARQDQLRVPGLATLQRLSEFGADAAPSLLFLIDDSERTGDHRSNNWQHPYLAGLIGFCKLGPEAAPMIKPMFDRIDAGKIALWGSYYRLTIATLVAMGAGPDDIWAHVQSQKTNIDNSKAHILQIAGSRHDCSY